MIKDYKKGFIVGCTDYKGGEITGLDRFDSLHELFINVIGSELYEYYPNDTDLVKLTENYESIIEDFELDEYTSLYAGGGSITRVYDKNLTEINIDIEDIKEIALKYKDNILKEIKRI